LYGGKSIIIEICIVGWKVTSRTCTFSNSNKPTIFK